MPKRPSAALAGPFIALALGACSGAGGATPEQLGSAATRDFALAGFERIELKGADSVIVHSGDAFAVRAEAPQGVLDRLELTVSGGTLKIGRRDNDWNWGGDKAAARITVTLPALAGATVTGSGDMTVDAAGGKAFAGNVTGSGDLAIARLEADAVTLAVAGSGDLKARGKIGRGDFNLAGSGDLDASDLEAEAIRASVAGSGNITARARGSAEISIAGSGDVTVGGGARCTVSKVGSGEAKCG